MLINIASLTFWAEPQALNSAVHEQKAEVYIFTMGDDQNQNPPRTTFKALQDNARLLLNTTWWFVEPTESWSAALREANCEFWANLDY